VFKKTEVEVGRSVVPTPISVLLAIFAVISGTWSLANAVTMAVDQTAMELGYKVLAVREAIENPGAPNAMQAVTDLGHDQRYYVMVRGWLSYRLDGDRSILGAARGQTRDEVKERIHFLEKAIRAIDLE
jgi:hypothetical protein